MIYYVDNSILGPFKTKDNLLETTNSLSMTFPSDFQTIDKLEGKIYEWSY